MADHNGNDVLVKIGADAADFNLTLEGLAEHVKDFVKEINPIVGLAVAAVASIGFAAIESAEAFEGAFNTLIDKTGAEGDKLESLQSSFVNVFTGVPEAAGKVADAIATISIRLDLTETALED